MTRLAKGLCVALLTMEALWGTLFLVGPSTCQDRVFCGQGKAWFLDYKAPREWSEDVRAYHPENVNRWDISCYPPISYDLLKPFPRDHNTGGPLFAAFSALCLAAGLAVLARRLFPVAPIVPTIAVMLSFPMLFVFSTGNSLPQAVAAVCLYFAWKDEDGWRRVASLAALSIAIALKISPVFFSLILLIERRWRDFMLVGFLSAALVFVPFVWHGGLSAFGDFLQCLHNRADYYGIRDSWGFVGLDRCLRLGLGLGIESTRQSYPVTRTLNVVFALACLGDCLYKALGKHAHEPSSRRAALILLTVSLLMLPGGSVLYNALLLVPAFLLDLSLSSSDDVTPRSVLAMRGCAWMMLFCPLQIPFSFSSVNIPAASLALLALGLSAIIPLRPACRMLTEEPRLPTEDQR